MTRERERAERCFALARSTTFDGERESAIARGVAIAEKAGLDLDGFDIPGRAKAKPTRPTMSGKRASRVHVDEPRYSAFHEFGGLGGANGYSAEDVAEVMRRFHETVRRQQAAERAARQAAREARERKSAFDDLAATMRRRQAETGARPDETVQDAMRRNFDRAAAEAKARDAARGSANLDDLVKAERDRQARRARWPSPSDTASFLFSRGVPVYDTGDTDDGPRWFAPGRTPDRFDDDGLRELADEVGA